MLQVEGMAGPNPSGASEEVQAIVRRQESPKSASRANSVQRDAATMFCHREPFLKRPLDVLLSGLGLLVSAPFWILIALAIKLEDGGPVFYRQERWGKGGSKFHALKFRSMDVNGHPAWGSVQAEDNDPRVTRVGRVMRRMALDELPQILNILRGDMSFVGPRALPINERQQKERHSELPDEAIPNFDIRSRVRPGLTGLAQVYAPRDVPRRHKFRYDLLYIRRQGFLFDLKLIVFSVWISLRGRWESRGKRF